MHACLAQSCLTLCDSMDFIPPQAPLSMGFSRQDYWGGLPCPPPGDLPNPGIRPRDQSHVSGIAGRLFTTELLGKHLPYEPALPPLDMYPAAAAAAKSLQSCPTLCDLIDRSPPGSAVPGILQARTLECAAKTIIQKDTPIPMFIAALFIITRTWKQFRCASIDECIKTMWYIYTMEY